MMAAATSFKIGQPVRWIPLDAAGRPCAELTTAIRSFEDVRQSDGSLNRCAILTNNRLASLDRLFAMDAPAIEIEKPATAPRPAKKPAAPSVAEKTKTRTTELKPAASPKAEAVAPCEVLAFDFMNLLVRAWHAGKPTETHAVRSMFQTVANAVRQLRPQRIVFAMDGGHVHRSKLLPEYKSHRPPHPPELKAQIELATEALRIAGIPAFRVQNWEADDVLASLVERCPAIVICSSDKDLLALHGRCRIFHPWTGGGFVDPETKLGLPAGQVTDFLAMCGDVSDGVPGVKGIGEKTALKLLQDHENLEAILVAAQMNQIPGAIGKHLREQRAAALLCQSVIQLRSSLPLPELLPWDTPVGFQQRLQSIGLGSVAAILDGISNFKSQISNVNTTKPQSESPLLSASTGQEEQNGRDEFLSDQQELQPVQPSRASQTESSLPSEPVVPAEPVSQRASTHLAGGSAAIRVTRSISEPIRRNLNMIQRWDLEDKGMISCWEAGREAAADPEKPNIWKPETPNWFAFEQGRKGLDLDVFWYPPEAETPAAPKPPRHDPPQKRKAGSLF